MPTPTLKRSWGFTGASSNQPDTGDDFTMQLEPSGTPCAVVAGDLIVVFVSCASSVLTSVATSSGGVAVYTGTIASGLQTGATNAFVGMTFKVSGFPTGANNGTFTCSASTATTVTLSNASAVAETHAAKAAFSPTITDDGGNTYSVGAQGVGSRNFTIFYTLATAYSSKIKMHYGAKISDVQWDVALFYNVATSSPLDGAGLVTTGITPANNTPPNVSSGSYTTTVDGDLVINFVAEDTTNALGANAISALAYGTGFNGLFADMVYGSAGQYQVQANHGAINPGMTFTQTSHDTFASVVIAIKAGSGGAAPTAGMSILHSQTSFQNNVPSSNQVIPFPAGGDLIVICNEAGTLGTSLTSVTDNKGNSYATIAVPSQYPQFFYAKGAATGPDLVITLHFGAGTGTDLIMFYDLASGAALNQLNQDDKGATAANSSVLTGAGSGATRNLGSNGTPELMLSAVATSSGGNAVYTGTITGGTANAFAGLTFQVQGFTGSNNSGVFTCSASTTTTVTLANASATAETHAALLDQVVVDAPSIRPSSGLGVCIAGINIGQGPFTGMALASLVYDYCPATWNSGGGDQNGFLNGDGMAHCFIGAAPSTQNFEWETQITASPSWQAAVVAFTPAVDNPNSSPYRAQGPSMRF